MEDALHNLGARLVPFPGLPEPGSARRLASRPRPPRPARPRASWIFSGADWLSSLELGALVELSRACRRLGGRVFLWNPRERTANLLTALRARQLHGHPASLAGLRLLLIELGAADRNGSVWRGPDGALVLHLPAELTAANVEDLRASSRPPGTARRPGARLARVAVEAARLRFIDTSASVCWRP